MSIARATEVMEIAAAVMAAIGTASVAILGLSSWLGRIWADRLMQREVAKHQTHLEGLRSELRREEIRVGEELKSQLKRLESEHSVMFSRLHERRAEVLAALYEALYSFQSAISALNLEHHHREIREDIDRTDPHKREPWELKAGIDTLSPEEEQKVQAVSDAMARVFDAYGPKRLYVPAACCVEVDRFCAIAAFLSSAYQSIAVKDHDGKLYVNPIVKESWDTALAALPVLMTTLESQFRRILGDADGR